MKLYGALFIALFSFPTLAMDELTSDVIIKTSDRKLHRMPRWQIRESYTLYTLFLKKLQKSPTALPVRISTPTLSLKEIKLYNTALEQKNFDFYYKNHLTAEERNTLLIATGKHARNRNNYLIPKLHDITLSMKLLKLHCDAAMLKKNLYPFLPAISCVTHYFTRKAIIKNATEIHSNNNKLFTRLLHSPLH